METQSLQPSNLTSTSGEFLVGTTVIHPAHGKCVIRAIETRTVDQQVLRFYKLEIQRSTFSRSNKVDPSIWIPVNTAIARGLREPLNRPQAEALMEIFSNREYYFSLDDSWYATLPLLEKVIAEEGAVGMAKVYSYLFVLKKRALHISSQVARFDETVHKFLYRELSEALDQPIKALEEQVTKLMRKKLLPDN